MKIVAITKDGTEYLYRAKTAHKVAEKDAGKICAVLNEIKFMIQPGEKWFTYDYDPYTNAGAYADGQSFSIRKGIVKRRYAR